MNYRQEIDGLRALAVVPVILFHAGFDYFSGGFIGVDIFFVISGYLITSLLLTDIENDRFSIFAFYERRARRILPALIVVMLCSIPLAWISLPQNQMNDFSQSLLATTFFVSNILFWLETGYFDTASSEKPLVHTWSLAVEEQYYLLFPIFILFSMRHIKSHTFNLIALLSLASLCLSEWASRSYPSANFYLAPTRAWELLAGSLSAFLVRRHGVRNNPLSLIGLIAIILCIFTYDESTPFPGIYALIPVAGTVLLILFASKDSLAARILSKRLFVGIGLISYSAYLWHQPLLAFYAHSSFPDVKPAYYLLVITTFILSYFSWKYIEQPFRLAQKIHRKAFIPLLLASLAFIVAFGIAGHMSNGFPEREQIQIFKDLNRVPTGLGYMACPENLKSSEPELTFCYGTSATPSALIVGDSHADDKFHGISKSLNQYEWRMIGSHACPPLGGVHIEIPYSYNCADRMNKVFNYIESQHQVELVILSFAHMYPLKKLISPDISKFQLSGSNFIDLQAPEKSGIQVFYDGLENRLVQLQKLGKQVVILIDIPELSFVPIDCLRGKIDCSFGKREVISRQSRHRLRLSAFDTKFDNVIVFDPIDLFCTGSQCSILHDSRSLYIDGTHLSRFGSERYGEVFAGWLSNSPQFQRARK